MLQWKTNLKSNKHVKKRNYRIGKHLDIELYVHFNDRGVIAHVLNKIIMPLDYCPTPDSISRVVIQFHIPVPGEIVKSRHCMLEQSETNDMHCITDQKTMEREP